MAGRLDGQVAIITGATSGIGEGTAERFAAEGARVVIVGRSEKQGQAIAARLGPNAAYFRGDMTREADCRAMVEFAKQKFGRLDCLFNNAGASTAGYFVEGVTEDAFAHDMKLLAGSVLFGTKHAVPVMRAQGGGSIINNASIAGMGAGYGPIVYSAAKAAVIQLTKTLAMELAKDKIRVNAISPGVIVTPIFGRALGLGEERTQKTLGAMGAALASLVPHNRAGEPGDIASAAVYLASPDSAYVTGQNIVVDGGMTNGVGYDELMQRLQKLSAVGQ
jgi:NAD(P)-dependent dehydrogenase (short-subunit alcohol dehydrogenase family)